MNVVVPVKLVPDLVEELEIDGSGAMLDTTFMRLIVNEFDDHAIEQAVLLKEGADVQASVLVPNYEGADDVLYNAAAKGADRLIKLVGDFDVGVNNHALARALTPVIKDLGADLVLTGVSAYDNLDGALGPLLAETLGIPYVGYVAGVKIENGKCTIRKEFPGGLIGVIDVSLPAVLGIQAAEEPPRYIAISRVRQAMKTATIEEHEAADLDPSGGPAITKMFMPETGERAVMLEGDEDSISDAIVGLLQERGIL